MLRRSPDFWSGLALVALGVYILLETRGWEYLSQEGPGPAFFPRWYGLAIFVLGAALAVGGAKSTPVEWRGAGRALGAWAVLAGSIALMKFAGFALGFAVLTYFIVAWMYRRPALQAALVAGAMLGAFYLIFALALGVALP
jgi:putative tricarboxylic transport membrane protein